MGKNAAGLLLIFVFSSAAVVSQTPCDIEAAINNRPEDYSHSLGGVVATTDRTGTNVRTGPGTGFPVSRTLKDRDGLRFHITASSGSWVRVDSVYEVHNQAEDYRGETPIDGWVYAPSLFLKAEPSDPDDASKAVYNLYSLPDMKSRLLLRKGEVGGLRVASLRGCRGKWAKVYHKGKVGWLNPFTQCADLWTESCAEGGD